MVVSMQFALDFDRMFGALADRTRRDIVRRAIDGEEGVAELASHYPMSFAAVQKHVAILERAGLVTKLRIGRRKVVRTDLEGLRVARASARPVRGAVARADRPHDRAHHRHEGDRPMTVTAVRKDPQTLHDDPGGRVRRIAGAGVAALGRSAPARALVGPADLPRDLHEPRPARRAAGSSTT